MAVDYAEFVELADEMLRDWGAAATIKSETEVGFNKATGRQTAGTTTTTDTFVAALPSETKIEEDRLRKVTPLLVRDEVKIGDVITMGERFWTVIGVKVVQPTNLPIIYLVEGE